MESDRIKDLEQQIELLQTENKILVHNMEQKDKLIKNLAKTVNIFLEPIIE